MTGVGSAAVIVGRECKGLTRRAVLEGREGGVCRVVRVLNWVRRGCVWRLSGAVKAVKAVKALRLPGRILQINGCG